MLAVRAMRNGLEIEFTKPLDPRCGWEAGSYYIEQWPFDNAHGAGPTRDGAVYPVKSASVSADRNRVFLEIDSLKPSHVVYLRLLPPCLSEAGELPWSTEAWYTLNTIPKDRAGEVLTPPPAPPQNLLTDAEKAQGWRLLFDGKTTAGWHNYRKPPADSLQGWAVADGCLVRVGPGGDIATDDEFANFELKLEWRVGPAGNSGIFYRVSEAPPNRYVWETGPEMQVLDNAEHADGRSPLTSAGSNYALYAPPKDVTRAVGLFNEARIVVMGSHVEHWLNGEKLVEYELGSPDWESLVKGSKFASMPRYGREKTGHIALQDHGDKVWFRNIKVRPLP
jgi:cytochrome c